MGLRERHPHPRGARATISVSFIASGLGHGGAQRQLVYMLTALRDSPVECRLLSLRTAGTWEPEVKALGVPLDYIGESTSRLARQAAIVRVLRTVRPDVVQSAHFYTNLYASVGARAVGAVSVGASRNDLRSEIATNWPLGWAQLYLPQYFLANSAASVEQALARRRSPDRVRLIENVIDTGRFAASDRVDHDPQEFRLLLVGRLDPQKRIERFLRLVKALTDALPDRTVTARIAGIGRLEDELKAESAHLGLDPANVRFLGRVTDMVSLYAWADAFVLTSDYEGTPNVVMEAMACEVPVIAFAVSGIPTLLSQGGGLLVPPGDEQALFESALALARSPERRRALGAEGRRYVCENRSVAALGRWLETYYRTILEASRR